MPEMPPMIFATDTSAKSSLRLPWLFVASGVGCAVVGGMVYYLQQLLWLSAGCFQRLCCGSRYRYSPRFRRCQCNRGFTLTHIIFSSGRIEREGVTHLHLSTPAFIAGNERHDYGCMLCFQQNFSVFLHSTNCKIGFDQPLHSKTHQLLTKSVRMNEPIYLVNTTGCD